ncbi:NAD-dependent epimerase/dehydratase family protein [Chitinophaga lutea]|uniref:NAD-dependent epimerase/dehydratase family protein n=1 Tax=Chitinophaga lutea TaxID=2488634 RepID=A0A3N4PZM6_9BACT|nr:NAD(P)H-binding protein [Chitinophaga lutea]RPE12369.1 NAD-dependent epimerase/dehydratase family protein [Chitinophaga lutea]
MPKTAIVTGATGLIGNLLVQALLNDGSYERVRAIVRKPLPIQHPRLENVVVSFDDDRALAEALRGDVLFCCIGTTIKKAGSQAAFTAVDYGIPVKTAGIAIRNGVTQYHLVSAVGANARSANFYLRTKGQTEEALIQMGFPSLFIYRPSLLMGERKEVRFGEQVGQLFMPVFKFLMVGGWRKYRPVKAATVAATMLANAKSGAVGIKVVEGFAD